MPPPLPPSQRRWRRQRSISVKKKKANQAEREKKLYHGCSWARAHAGACLHARRKLHVHVIFIIRYMCMRFCRPTCGRNYVNANLISTNKKMIYKGK